MHHDCSKINFSSKYLTFYILILLKNHNHMYNHICGNFFHLNFNNNYILRLLGDIYCREVFVACKLRDGPAGTGAKQRCFFGRNYIETSSLGNAVVLKRKLGTVLVRHRIKVDTCGEK